MSSSAPGVAAQVDRSTVRPRPSLRPLADWRNQYARRLAFSDIVVLAVVVFGVQIAWFGLENGDVAINDRFRGVGISYITLSVLLIAIWSVALGIMGSRGYRVLGAGPQEYKLIADATARVFGLLAIVAFLFKIEFARGYILVALPLGLIALVVSRWWWRRSINRQRRTGLLMSRVVLVGSPESAAAVARDLIKAPEAGYLVVGYANPAPDSSEGLPGLPDVPSVKLSHLTGEMYDIGADTVVITNSQDLSPQRVREISWSLEPGRQHLVVSPGLTDVGGPRIHTRPVAGLPLVHVETPRYEGAKLFSKRAFDIAGSGLFLILLAPVLIVTAVAVKVTSPGSVLFRQQRIGRNGGSFHMLKFRSMVVDAEDRLAALRESERDAGNTVMFKMKNDPRITPVGRLIRRFSIDELPQLFNVLLGSMSLVGPRPPLPTEVVEYENHVHRRFLVKPGITGLWQVSGRSNLSWADSVRLDLFYVENWSPASDLMILWKTMRAVLQRDGAY
jgi:exopolysaccharide biosynthesis polyprenyl glycosylphosphotransferase